MTSTTNVTETAAKLNEKVEAMRRKANGALETCSDGTAEALHSAAFAIQDAGKRSTETIDDVAAGAQKKIRAVTSYVDQVDPAVLAHDAKRVMFRNPGTFALAAMAIGAALGYMAGSQSGKSRG